MGLQLGNGDFQTSETCSLPLHSLLVTMRMLSWGVPFCWAALCLQLVTG